MESRAAWALIKGLQIPLTVLSYLNLDGPLFPKEGHVFNNSCHDYIIIGAGTAGCVLGNRLSEDPNTTVLMIEAGGNPPIPSFFAPLFVLFPRSQYDWNFTSTYNDYSATSQDNYTKLTSGKVLGGTSSISHFIYERGSPEDYDNWAKLLDDETWSFRNVETYFKKAEKLEDPEILKSDYVKYHGLNGPGAITRLAKKDADRYIEAFNETGKLTPLDINTDLALGYTQCLFTISELGERQSTAYSYITPVIERKNLRVLRYTYATRIMFEGKRAVAVVTIRKGKVYVFRARKEIIVSAGVYNSPKLLMLSGIGHKKHLEELNIPVVANLPVGDNFRDQVSISLVYRMEGSILPPPLYAIDPLTVPFPVICGLSTINPGQIFADYFTFGLILPQNTPFLILACAIVFQFKPEICDSFNKQTKLHATFYNLFGITQPYSTGYVRLKSNDPFEKPLITTNYFKNSTDLDNMVKYIKHFNAVSNSTYFKKVQASIIDPGLRECKSHPFDSDEYWKCYVLNNAGSVFHTSSTCTMAKNSAEGVVDSKFRVFDVTNLRVVDASVMPTLTNGGPYQPVLMMAEKAADVIKKDNNIDDYPSCKEKYTGKEKENGNDKKVEEKEILIKQTTKGEPVSDSGNKTVKPLEKKKE